MEKRGENRVCQWFSSSSSSFRTLTAASRREKNVDEEKSGSKTRIKVCCAADSLVVHQIRSGGKNEGFLFQTRAPYERN